jgi:hypothetical protein
VCSRSDRVHRQPVVTDLGKTLERSVKDRCIARTIEALAAAADRAALNHRFRGQMVNAHVDSLTVRNRSVALLASTLTVDLQNCLDA